MMSIKKSFYLFSLLLIVTLSMTVLLAQQQQTTQASASGSAFPHVKGAQIFNGNNQPLMLRGAMIETPFAYIGQWQNGKDPLTILNTTTFTAMAQSWHMNAVRINISEWIYNLNPSTYLTKLDTAVQQANAAGLFVIIDFHDDAQSGAVAPYNDGMLHTVSLNWWKTIAKHYLNNPMIMFDLINEPQYRSWATWLHGDGGDVVGIVNVISAIRSIGAKQIIVVEPGTAGGGTSATEAGWATFDPATITDPSIVYSRHIYQGIISGNPSTWDQQWGALLNTHAIYYGEWGVLPDPYQISHCTGLTSSNADSLTNAFLAYLGQRHASWTAWQFRPYNLIQDTTNFTRTSFATGAPWVCGSASAAQAGMGTDVKNYLTA